MPLSIFRFDEFHSGGGGLWTLLVAICLSILVVAFNPTLNKILKGPLWNILGMKYGSIYISLLRLKLKIKAITLQPHKSDLVKLVILIIFPSANVMLLNNSVDFPESKITVGKLTVKIRLGSLATRSTADIETDEENVIKKEIKLGWFASMNRFIPRPVVSIILYDVAVHIEKAYLAPKPPALIQNNVEECTTDSLPLALQLSNHGEEEDLPTFDQTYFWKTIEDEGFSGAETITRLVERWIEHAVTKLNTKGGDTSSPSATQRKGKSKRANVQTYDEKVNAWIKFFIERLSHCITLDLVNASIVISGAGSEYVAKVRKNHSPREANLRLARLPKHRRALTVIGADLISFSFSPDSQCSLLCCLVGSYLKVGDPHSSKSRSSSATALQYTWHHVIDPFQCILELKGVIPFLVFSLSYDHYWETRSLDLHLSVSEKNLSLSPQHIHTVFLHLDEYTDASSPLVQWLEWLRCTRSEVVKLTVEQKDAYCQNYARIKGVKQDEPESNDARRLLTPKQMRDMESEMNMWEILSLRCFTMRKHWLIPKENEEFSEFLRSSRSSISFSSDVNMDSLDGAILSPFQQVFPTPLHALFMLVWEKSSIMAPHITFTFSAGTYKFDFPTDLGENESFGATKTQMIPSSLTSSGVEFRFEQSNPLFQSSESTTSYNSQRSFINLSLHVAGLRWGVVIGEDDAILNELPHFRGSAPAGIIYERNRTQRLESVISIGLGCSISPTIDREPHFNLSFHTSDLVIVVNPLPLLSTIENFIGLLQFPFQPQTVNDESIPDNSDTSGSFLSINSDVNISVRNISFLFLVDRKKLNRGLLDFNVSNIALKLKTGGSSGKLTISTGPFALESARVSYQQSHFTNRLEKQTRFRDAESIQYWLMPFKPIILMKGVEIVADGKEGMSETSPDVTILGVNLNINANSLDINASPSTVVAIRGVITSFEPFLSWIQGDACEEARITQMKLEEEERKSIDIQRQVLKKIFDQIDADGSGALSDDEFEQVVVMLWKEARPDFTLTDEERRRETEYIVSMVDRSKSNEISYQDLDEAIQMLAGNIEDNNLVPKGHIVTGDFARSDQFLSSFQLRQLIYFDDLKEYASMHIVRKITGGIINETDASFPSPSLWQQGRGIDIFWDMYVKGTGCSRRSLHGQSLESVQRQLVRSFCNYEFAKFCWKSIVQPELSSDSYLNTTNTRWVLDENHSIHFRSGITDLLREHVTRVTKESMEGASGQVVAPIINIQYDLSLTAVIKSASAKFGSSHNFAKPLLEASVANTRLDVSALLSENGFVESCESSENDSDSTGTNIIQFQGVISAMYLNTKHNHMECFIESYPCYGQATYRVLRGDPSLHPKLSKAVSSKTWSVKLDCPRFFNINTSPSFFETASIFSKIIGQSDPQSHREFLYRRDLGFIRNFWDSSPALENGCLDHESALDVMCGALDAHWQLEMEGLPPATRREMMSRLIEGLTASDSDVFIPFSAVEAWLRNLTSRCYFTGIEAIQLDNDSGTEIKVTTKKSFDKQRSSYAVVNEENFYRMINSFQGIGHGNKNAVSLQTNNIFSEQSLCGNLSMYLPGFKLLEDVPVNPYQTLMFKLKMQKGMYGKSNRRNSQGVSGFKPYLTVVPNSTSLDAITLYVRSNIVIRSEVPVKVRIVRLGKSAGQFSKQGLQKRNKTSIDLTKKYLMTALKRAVEGAPIVYERMCKGEGDAIALPLSLLVSSCFHAILIQDVPSNAKNAWRDPLLFTKDFLFNPANIRDVARYHTMSGVVVQKERLNVQNTGKGRSKSLAGDVKQNMTRRTAWDITILVVPSFLCMNSLPFPVSVKVWQYASKDGDDDWDGAAASLLVDEEDTSSDDDETAMTPSIQNKGVDVDQYHLSTSDTSDYYHEDLVNVGETLQLSGISLAHPLFIEVSQHLKTTGTGSLSRASPVQIDLQQLKTGMNRKGSRSLPKKVLDLGDNCDCLIDVALDRASKMPLCTFYSPFWIVNKTGMKLEYRVDGSDDGHKRYLDSGAGGLPVLMNCSKADETNTTLVQGAREFSVIPLESPQKVVLENWWDEGNNGKLVLKKDNIVDVKSLVVDWSKETSLEAAGTDGEIHCNSYVLQANIESLAGVFHRSNLIKLTPRFIVKNGLHISISVLPLAGSPRHAKKMSMYLRESLSESEEKSLINLLPGESTVIYNFKNIHLVEDSSYRWIAFRVNASRFRSTFKCRWHMVPLDVMQSNLYAEKDGVNDTLAGIVEAKVHSSTAGSILTSITHADTPPFRIENRSQTHYLQISQDDDEAEIFELPPMHSCGYTWDCPLGKKRLCVAVVPGRKSSSKFSQSGKTLDSDLLSTASTIDSDDDSVEGEAPGDPLLHSLIEGIPTHAQKDRKKGDKTFQQWVNTRLARKYNLQKIGRQKDLHCPKSETDWMSTGKQNRSGECLKVHTRVSTGTKVISFSDSDWLAGQVEAGQLRRGGDFKSALIDINVEGAGIYFNDNFPRELLGILVRDLQICKPMGSIEFVTRVRHFQIDAMLPKARYPIVMQPMPLGVDRRVQEIQNSSSSRTIIPHGVKTSECYWKNHDEKPIPLFEMTCSYVPQNKMVWIPNLEVQLCPMKLQMDVNYILRVLSLIFDSVSKYYRKDDIESNPAIAHVNENLNYVTRGSMNVCLTYIEKFCIYPVEVQIEINIKSDDEDFDDFDGSTSLTLHTISQSTNSELISGIMGWLINVGANFAHVSPTYTYKEVCYTDTYSDIVDLAVDTLTFYVMQSIKQCYKVVFSMHLLGDPSLLLHQWKTGVKDFFVKTAEEIASGGKDGVGKGVGSLLQNAVGGTFFAFGRITGSVADTITAATTTELTSEKLKPKSAASNGRNPDHVGDGLLQGTEYLTRTVAHGIAGLIGNPYRGAKSGSLAGVAKGVTTGIVGVVTCPLVGALGFVAKTSTGIGQTTKLLDLGYIEARCRPRRVVPWGMAMSINEMPYLKGIGIRIHTVRYQKVRKRAANADSDGENDDDVSKRERRRMKAAEKRRLDPPSKQVSIKYQKDKYHYLSNPIRPKLLSDHPGNLVLSHYAVTFEETIELRSSDLQLDDTVTINFWNHKMLKITPKAKALALCTLSVGDMYSHALTFYLEQLKRAESNLSKGNSPTHNNHHHDDKPQDLSLILPAPQEFPLFRPLTKSKSDRKDIFEAIQEEMVAIEKTEEDRLALFASDSDAESDSSFLSSEKKKSDEGTEELVSRNERLFGSVSLSFFPIPW